MLATKQCEVRNPERRARGYMRHTETKSLDGSSLRREAVEQRMIYKSASIREAAEGFIRERKTRRVFICYPSAESLNRAETFNNLTATWRRDTGKFSMLHKIVLHPAYQQIIGMGEKALPYIFRELNARGGHWIWALSAITGKYDVAKPEHTFREAREAWLQWGQEHGFL